MKCLLAVSASREWSETDFLMNFGKWKFPAGWQIKTGWFRQFTAAERHNVAVNEAFYNYDRLIFLDTDQEYPPEYISMLLEHDEPVVTGLNVSRYHPYEFTIYKITGEADHEGIKYPTWEYMEPPEGQREFQCDMTGTGAMMLDPKILKELEPPYFQDIYDKVGAFRILCDDFYFCWLLFKAGISITVDTRIMPKHDAKVKVSAVNRLEMRRAFEKINSGHGYWKDGKK